MATAGAVRQADGKQALDGGECRWLAASTATAGGRGDCQEDGGGRSFSTVPVLARRTAVHRFRQTCGLWRLIGITRPTVSRDRSAGTVIMGTPAMDARDCAGFGRAWSWLSSTKADNSGISAVLWTRRIEERKE